MSYCRHGGGAQAARGDTIETRASLLQRQLRIGDACTWRLIEKNVVALLPPSQAYLKNQAAGALSDLIRCETDAPSLTSSVASSACCCTAWSLCHALQAHQPLAVLGALSRVRTPACLQDRMSFALWAYGGESEAAGSNEVAFSGVQCPCNMGHGCAARRSYEDLDDVLTRAHSGDTFAAEKAFDAMQYTISSAASFQTIIERCLDLPPALG